MTNKDRLCPQAIPVASNGAPTTDGRRHAVVYLLNGAKASVGILVLGLFLVPFVRSQQDQPRRDWRLKTTFQVANRLACAVAFSPSGQLLATGDFTGTVKIMDVQAGKEKVVLRGHKDKVRSLAFKDENLLASASGKTIILWDVTTCKEKAVLRGHRESVTCVRFSPDGRLLASSSHDRTVKLWDTKTWQERARFEDHMGPVYGGVAFSPDSKILAVATGHENEETYPGEVKLWDVARGEVVAVWQKLPSEVQAVAFSPDGKTLAAGCFSYPRGKMRGFVKLCDVERRRQVASYHVHDAQVHSLAFAPHGGFLLTGSYDCTAKTWNPATGKLLSVLGGHSDAVQAVAVSADGLLIATASWDGLVNVWEPLLAQ